MKKCLRCGSCCTYLTIGVINPDSRYEEPDVIKFLEYHGVTVIDNPIVPGTKTLHVPVKCLKLLPDGKCEIYETRPNVCRNFLPGVIPECKAREEENEN